MNKTLETKEKYDKSKKVAVIVAHPDDETLWAGGTIQCQPTWQWFIVCLCRASDSERAQKFYKALKFLKADGIIGDLDDGPEQKVLDESEVESSILRLLPLEYFDLIISHNPSGEYTRHLRHEETGKAVIKLWNAGKIFTKELWTFAYEDGKKQYYPRPIKNAPIYQVLPQRIRLKKYRLITEIYGFEKNSWETNSITKSESFWKFTEATNAENWLNDGAVLK